MTIGDLRRQIEGLCDDAPVYYQRIEDSYFRESGWKTVDFHEDPHDEALGLPPSQFIRAFTGIRRKDDNAFYLTAHY